MSSLFSSLLVEINDQKVNTITDYLQNICAVLHTHVEHYNWVGFYFMNHQKKQLEIGPYVGEKTDHTVIPFGRGICGQVAVSGKTVEVPNVAASDNYLACSLSTKAEIVVPIYIGTELVGQLDIDSHEANPFTQSDHDFLNEICSRVADKLALLSGTNGINGVHVGSQISRDETRN